ncbi:MAG: BREX-1 system adenine-specific DNA-methyltransferase PglX [Bacteroidales bacterium]|nr:BREX-1 system adenine-specific DNA-methyltransferase PglX [Bacteroidales bacterium]
MNTSQIKNFAIQSRNILKTGVIQRIQILGFDANGNLTKGEPTRIDIQGGATLFAGEIYDGPFYDRWMSLRSRIQEKGVKEVYEEAAYTWFNRLVAIRIMQKNGFIDPVLAYTNEQTRIPRIVAEARAGRVGQMTPADREKLRDLMGDDARINEQFAILIENFCQNNPVIFNCFGGIEEYISLLLPENILAPGGFIDLLNHTSYITEDDYKQSELIGWLYQFYISEKKDEVFDGFKKGKKAEAEDIPAATQIFTPNWIVKYMVQNTIGRIYLDNNPWATDIKDSMKYLVEPAEPTPKDAILKLESLEDYKLLDNACGSGHILVEAFGLFYKMYLEEGYSSRSAIENILRKNILGIDLDTRAKQLATFALLMTAAKIDPSFLDCKVMPRVLDMPGHNFSKPVYELLREFYMGEDRTVMEETMKAFELLKQADNLGSIMKFDLSAKTRREMALRYKEWCETTTSSPANELLHSIALILALTDRYTSVVMNPPYMGNNGMNDALKLYVDTNYPVLANDLGAVFIDVAYKQLAQNGVLGMINQATWLFKPSYSTFRQSIVNNNYGSIRTLLYLGPGTFEEIKGEVVQSVCFTLQNYDSDSTISCYNLKKFKGSLTKANALINKTAPCYIRKTSYFTSFSDNQFGFWIDEDVMRQIGGATLSDVGDAKQGIKTGENPRFLRLWQEISYKKFNRKWFPVEQGGDYRKWYGNQFALLNWENDGYEIKHFTNAEGRLRSRPQNIQFFFKSGLTWSTSAGDRPSFRYSPESFTFESSGSKFFLDQSSYDKLCYYMAYLNSYVAKSLIDVFSPGIGISEGAIKKLPFINREEKPLICQLSKANVAISRSDWDVHETSWDFKENELVRLFKENLGDGIFMNTNRLEEIVDMYKEYWTKQFNQLHANEEELNRQFIEIYGLQDELSPDVPLDEITILQQGEISIEEGSIVWHNDVLAKQLLSYAIGCMMGRYRLDRPGLHIAYPNPTSDDIASYSFQGESFEIDDDGIIPLLGRDCPFDDNAYNRVVKFIRQVFGESFLNENLNYIEDALGKTIENYFVKDFWKDHKKMYSNRPIYWLFSSKKGAFQCLTYMHRMNPYTAELVRSKYLLPYIDFLKNKVAADMDRASTLSTVERRQLDKMQIALDECMEYEERLHDVADQQIHFDLDDGVVANYAKFGDVLAKIK